MDRYLLRNSIKCYWRMNDLSTTIPRLPSNRTLGIRSPLFDSELARAVEVDSCVTTS
jgi:hypothetical protein